MCYKCIPHYTFNNLPSLAVPLSVLASALVSRFLSTLFHIKENTLLKPVSVSVVVPTKSPRSSIRILMCNLHIYALINALKSLSYHCVCLFIETETLRSLCQMTHLETYQRFFLEDQPTLRLDIRQVLIINLKNNFKTVNTLKEYNACIYIQQSSQ